MGAVDAAAPAPSDQQGRVPAVIASHVNVKYTVYGTGKRASNTPTNVVAKWLDRTRRHVGTRQVHAVKDVSFVAYRGESIGIVGRNGSGKSTLLRAVAGLLPAESGEIYLYGRAALLGVNAVLMRQLTGARNIFIGGQALGLSRSQVRAQYRDIVKFADIGEFVNLPMSSYSSGMAARLRFAISTAAVPDILVVDEALSTGDALFRAKAAARIESFRQAAGTILMVNHNHRTIREQCDRVLWMEQGELVMDGPTEQVLAAYLEFTKAMEKAQTEKGKGSTKRSKGASKRRPGRSGDA